MPEWLQNSFSTSEVGWQALCLRVGFAAALGICIAVMYAATQRRQAGHKIQLGTTLVLLTVLVAMTTIVIGDSVARAFGLVGALSIVRFRTVVEDTRDTAFVIFAVVVGMALGAGNLRVCAVGVPIIGLVAAGLSVLNRGRAAAIFDRRLEVRISAGRDPEQLLRGVLDGQLQNWKLVSVISARQGVALDLVYRVRLRESATMLSLVKGLTAIEGVQGVELKDE
jgi:hypothetical protein